MREILFRAKRIDNGKWVCGTPFQEYNNFWGDWLWIIQTKHPLTNVPYMHLEVDKKTISEFTGLFDKEGERIFEGDIVEYRSYTGTGFEEINHAIVFWDEHRWSYERIYSNRWTENWNCKGYKCDIYKEIVAKYGKVIGNIHDNPELLG